MVRLTKVGGSYLLFTFVIGFAALNTGNNSLYIALSTMLGLLIVSGMASKDGLRSIDVEVSHLGEAWAGKPATGSLRLRNRSRLWTVRDLLVTGPHLAEPVFVPIVERRGTVEITATFLFERRGRVSLTRVDLYTRFPFGLFTKKRRAKLSGSAVVFPRLLPDETLRDDFAPTLGERSPRNAAGPGTEIFAFREYVRGDSLRHVHWKKSASIGRWVMKQSQQDANPIVAITFDPFMPSTDARERFEQIVSEAATAVRNALDRGYDVHFHLGRQASLVGQTDRGISAYEALALVEPQSETPTPFSGTGVILYSLRSGNRDARTA
ncbi:MAG: DUF58 domain-containing protein [Acidobacteria bacterium]|nr:DUF58 domain-containing protein [Acidobacteriota bacterium]